MEDDAPLDAGLNSGVLALVPPEGSADGPTLAELELVEILCDDETFHEGPLADDRLDEGRPEDGMLDDEDDFVCFENDEADSAGVEDTG